MRVQKLGDIITLTINSWKAYKYTRVPMQRKPSSQSDKTALAVTQKRYVKRWRTSFKHVMGPVIRLL